MPAGRIPKPVGTALGHRKRTEMALSSGANHGRAVPRAPAGLLASSRKRWRAYWESNLAQAVDRQVDLARIERWILTSDECEKVSATLKRVPLVKGSTGQPAMNPLLSYLSVLLAELRAAETELGMTPLARQRLGIEYGRARLTMQDLNRMMRERRGQRERDPLLDEWEEA